jgi:SOS response regulatory protein OraA/RecX
MITREQACAIIDYAEEMSERTNHQSVMAAMREKGYSEEEIDKACQALGKIAGRTFRVL